MLSDLPALDGRKVRSFSHEEGELISYKEEGGFSVFVSHSTVPALEHSPSFQPASQVSQAKRSSAQLVSYWHSLLFLACRLIDLPSVSKSTSCRTKLSSSDCPRALPGKWRILYLESECFLTFWWEILYSPRRNQCTPFSFNNLFPLTPAFCLPLSSPTASPLSVAFNLLSTLLSLLYSVFAYRL
jgi:hypothetical protein